jgi:hypothetical protein
MKKYHLTINEDGVYKTLFVEIYSLVSFMGIQRNKNLNTQIIFAKELSDEEWEHAKKLKLI